ncbi:MAG: cytochrome c [Acidobacteriia bacterium]|nr:cytochrome c [Terriglobia bacterium]
MKNQDSSDPFRVNLPAAVRLALLSAAAIVFLVLCVPVGAQAPARNATPESARGNVEKGKQLYTSSGCYECHGREGQGSRFSGPRLGPPPISLGGFTEYTRQPRGQMPPYTSKVLSDAELEEIYAFLKSIPQPPPAKSIPLLN